jgi:8-oxo-dGTP pyrophosphatase MutT (NUDIX family)
MNIFINDHFIQIISPKKGEIPTTPYEFDKTIDLQNETLKVTHLSGRILLKNSSLVAIEKLFYFLNNFDLDNLKSAIVVTKDIEAAEKRVKKLFTVVKAAGGVVEKNEKILMMFRRGFWDLPKGKLDNNEKSKAAALREVEEETGVKAKLGEKICVTWHTYKQAGEPILKRTKWFVMTSKNDKKMKPQTEEDIEKLEWLAPNEVEARLNDSFESIRFVIEEYKKMVATPQM